MDLDFTWINLLILFGALQGLIFGIILLVNKEHPGSRYLGVFMLILSYNGFETFNWSSGLDEYNIGFDLLSFTLVFGLGPSLYLYIYSLLKPDERLTKRTIILAYSPLLFQLLVKALALSLYIYSLQVRKEVEPMIDSTIVYRFFYWYSEPVSVLVFWYFLALSVYMFRDFSDKNVLSSSPKSNHRTVIKWVKGLLICMMALAILWPIVLMSPFLLNIDSDVYYYPMELLLVFFIYWTAFVGYHKIKSIHPQKTSIATNSISSQEAQRHLATLKKAMEEDKLYLDSELNRDKMAKHVGIKSKIISAVLNQYANQNFNDFVNTYRVKEVENKLNSGESDHLTISGIAFEAGFNSQATFQRVFKSINGMSPKEFQSSLLQNN